MPESLQRGRWKGLVATALLCLFWAAGAQAASPNTAPPVTAAKAPTEPPALLLPVQGVAASDLRNTFDDGRDGDKRGHEAIDIMAARGTPVRAVDDGRITKLFLSEPGGITVYQLDPSGQFAYYYAHLEVSAQQTHLEWMVSVLQDRVHANPSCTPCSRPQRFQDIRPRAPTAPTRHSSKPNW